MITLQIDFLLMKRYYVKEGVENVSIIIVFMGKKTGVLSKGRKKSQYADRGSVGGKEPSLVEETEEIVCIYDNFC